MIRKVNYNKVKTTLTYKTTDKINKWHKCDKGEISLYYLLVQYFMKLEPLGMFFSILKFLLSYFLLHKKKKKNCNLSCKNNTPLCSTNSLDALTLFKKNTYII